MSHKVKVVALSLSKCCRSEVEEDKQKDIANSPALSHTELVEVQSKGYTKEINH